MRITENRLRRIIRSVIIESSSDYDERRSLLIKFCDAMGIDCTEDALANFLKDQAFVGDEEGIAYDEEGKIAQHGRSSFDFDEYSYDDTVDLNIDDFDDDFDDDYDDDYDG